MSNYKDLAFTPQQKHALELFGETQEPHVLDMYFNAQQKRIILLWSVEHKEPENAHIFFTRIQCKYLDALYEYIPQPWEFEAFEIGESVDAIIFDSNSIKNFTPNGTYYIMSFNVNGRRWEAFSLHKTSSYTEIGSEWHDTRSPDAFYYSTSRPQWKSSGTAGNVKFTSKPVGNNRQRIDFASSFISEITNIDSSIKLVNGVDYGKPLV